MKRVLITGEQSYIGTSVETWLNKWPEDFVVDTISVKGDDWRQYDFSTYDSVFHVAGIAHIKETKKNKDLYYKVNRDLAVDVAKYAKEQGVKQFIFLSSMSVYGLDIGLIDEQTDLVPKTNYGKSKLEAEKIIKSIEAPNFKVAILRPPIVYGEGAKGNYNSLAVFARKSPIFPKFSNERSMLYIGNLNEFIRIIIIQSLSGLFFPQNDEYVCTSDMVEEVSKINEKNTIFTEIFNPLIMFAVGKFTIFSKVFGSLIYDKNLSKEIFKYNVFNFTDSIAKTERYKN